MTSRIYESVRDDANRKSHLGEDAVTQESVWDYPRPPKIELTAKRIRVEFAGELVADTLSAMRVLETSHPPVYYIPLVDIRADLHASHIL